MGFEVFVIGINTIAASLLLAVMFTGLRLAAYKRWFAWHVVLLGQLLIILFAILTGNGKMVGWPLAFALIFAINAFQWHRDHRKQQAILKEMRENKSGTMILSSGVEVTYNTIEEDSNLIQHARRELNRIGEEPEIIEWYLRVIREYASFGHSGGSHFAVMPTLTRLLDYQPLGKLTNNPEEWMQVSPDHWNGEDTVWQNRRDSRAFSMDGGESYTLIDDRQDEHGKMPVYTSDCYVCFDNRHADEWSCPKCGAQTGNFVKD